MYAKNGQLGTKEIWKNGNLISEERFVDIDELPFSRRKVIVPAKKQTTLTPIRIKDKSEETVFISNAKQRVAKYKTPKRFGYAYGVNNFYIFEVPDAQANEIKPWLEISINNNKEIIDTLESIFDNNEINIERNTFNGIIDGLRSGKGSNTILNDTLNESRWRDSISLHSMGEGYIGGERGISESGGSFENDSLHRKDLSESGEIEVLGYARDGKALDAHRLNDGSSQYSELLWITAKRKN